MKISLEKLEIGYPGRRLIAAFDLTLRPGGLHFLIGRNGTGKSTLLRTMAGLHSPLSGKVLLDGESVFALSAVHRADFIYYLRGRNELRSRISVAEFLYIGYGAHAILRHRKVEWQKRLKRTADEVGIAALLDVKVQQLSDGEFQKMMIALVLLRDPQVLLLDEPLSHLDPPSQIEILDLLSRLAIDRTVLISSHHLMALRSHGHRIFLLKASQELTEIKEIDQLSDADFLGVYH